jgi:predicted aldo/keto reductase-like oxidoreductase
MQKLGFGLMRLPLQAGAGHSDIDQEQVNQMADMFLAAGGVYVDTAYMYHAGASEVAARRAFVERHPRDKFILADKMPIGMVKSADDYPRIFAEQLQRTGAGYFDRYLLHSLNRQNYANTVATGGFDFVKGLKADGRARRIGFSYHDDAKLLDEILRDHPEMEFVQLQINYIDWDNPAIQARACYEVAVKYGNTVIVMEPVKGGALAKVPAEVERYLRDAAPAASPASWALRFAASLPLVEVEWSGMSDLAQIRENTE